MNKKSTLVVIMATFIACQGDFFRQFKTSNFYDRYAYGQMGMIMETFDAIHKNKNYKELSMVDVRAVLKTFNTVGKRSDFINPYSFVATLKMFWVMFDGIDNDYFSSSLDMLDSLKEQHAQLLIGNFTNKYDVFQLNPTSFLREMACTINKSIKKEFEILQARYEVVRFIETHLDRLIWSPEDGIETWRNVEDIAKKLTNIFEDNLLDDINLLDDFYESLVGSYSRFITITDSMLSNEFYEQLKSELQQNSSVLFILLQEDGVIETRNEYLLRVVLRAYSRKQAQDHGVMA